MLLCFAVQAEVDRLLFEDPNPQLGFMLHPDLKWVPPPHHPLHGSNALMHKNVCAALGCNASVITRQGSVVMHCSPQVSLVL